MSLRSDRFSACTDLPPTGRLVSFARSTAGAAAFQRSSAACGPACQPAATPRSFSPASGRAPRRSADSAPHPGSPEQLVMACISAVRARQAECRTIAWRAPGRPAAPLRSAGRFGLARAGSILDNLVVDLDAAWDRAMELAWQSFLAGTTPVAAVITGPAGVIVAEGRGRWYEQPDGARQLAGGHIAHAEFNALAGLPPIRDYEVTSCSRRWNLAAYAWALPSRPRSQVNILPGARSLRRCNWPNDRHATGTAAAHHRYRAATGPPRPFRGAAAHPVAAGFRGLRAGARIAASRHPGKLPDGWPCWHERAV